MKLVSTVGICGWGVSVPHAGPRGYTVVARGLVTLAVWLSCAVTLGMPIVARVDARETEAVVVRDVTTRDGAVSGVIVNRSRGVVSDVRLLIRHTWHWNDEMHPGEESPGRAGYDTVEDLIAPGEEHAFTYRPSPPLAERPDGRFETSIEVVGYTQVGP